MLDNVGIVNFLRTGFDTQILRMRNLEKRKDKFNYSNDCSMINEKIEITKGLKLSSLIFTFSGQDKKRKKSQN